MWTGDAITGWYNSGQNYFSSFDEWYEGGYGSNSQHQYVYTVIGPLSQYWSFNAVGWGIKYDYTSPYYTWDLRFVLHNGHYIACYGFYEDRQYNGLYAGGSTSATVKADDTFNMGGGVYYTQFGSYNTITRSMGGSSLLHSQTVQTKLSLPIKSTQLFDVQVTYAYVGERTSGFSISNPFQNQTSIATLNPASLYPSLICLNATYSSNALNASCDAAIEVYQVQVTTDTGVTDSYLFTVGTNLNPAFSDVSQLSLMRPNMESLAPGQCTNAMAGYYALNLTKGDSISTIGVGSVGKYQSDSSTLGFWSAGQPNAITISVNRLGCILLNGANATTYRSNVTTATAQLQLERFGNGFLYNAIVPQAQLRQIDPFSPPI